MMCLTIKINEIVSIGDDIEVVVYRRPNGRTALGIKAPRELLVKRKGFYARNKKAQPKDSRAKGVTESVVERGAKQG